MLLVCLLACLWHLITNSPIHDFKVLNKSQRAFKTPFLVVYYVVLIYYFKNMTFCSTLNSWIGEFLFWCQEQIILYISFKLIVQQDSPIQLPYARHYNPLLIRNRSWILTIHKARILRKKLLEKTFLNFKKWVKNIQTAGYNGARTVLCSNNSKKFFDTIFVIPLGLASLW